MHERLPTDPAGLRERLRADPFGVVAVASVLALVVLVAAAGAISIYAETVGTWRSLFFMEQTLALLVPTVKALMVVSLAAGIGMVLQRD
jgi:hypothetical protein